MVVNGSFVTDKSEPNDVDCVILIDSGFPQDPTAEAELLEGIPFINLELVDQEAFDQFTQYIFASDRDTLPKGMIEAKL